MVWILSWIVLCRLRSVKNIVVKWPWQQVDFVAAKVYVWVQHSVLPGCLNMILV